MQLLQKQGDGRKEFAKVLKGWGVDFDSKQVAADIRHARRVQFGGGQGGEGMVTDFVAWLGLDKTDINPNDVLSAGIDEINLASAGVLTKVEGSPVDFSPIFETSSDAAIVGSDKVGFGADPLALFRNYVSGGHKLVLAARVSGEANRRSRTARRRRNPPKIRKPAIRMRKKRREESPPQRPRRQRRLCLQARLRQDRQGRSRHIRQDQRHRRRRYRPSCRSVLGQSSRTRRTRCHHADGPQRGLRRRSA